MILRRYGAHFHSVELNFDSKALSEVGFRRDRRRSIPVEELESSYERIAEHAIEAEARGDVQDATEAVLLDKLEAQIREVLAGLGDGELVIVENEQGHGWPKTKQKTRNVIVEGENRLEFTYTIAPPIHLAVHRKKG